MRGILSDQSSERASILQLLITIPKCHVNLGHFYVKICYAPMESKRCEVIGQNDIALNQISHIRYNESCSKQNKVENQ